MADLDYVACVEVAVVPGQPETFVLGHRIALRYQDGVGTGMDVHVPKADIASRVREVLEAIQTLGYPVSYVIIRKEVPEDVAAEVRNVALQFCNWITA